jgi:hypothetical protein
VLKRAGYHVTVTLLPFARAMQQTTEGGHMTGVFKSAEREELFKYSDRLGDDNVVVAVAKGKEFLAPRRPISVARGSACRAAFATASV